MNKLLTVAVVIALLLTCTLAAGATNVIVGGPSVIPDIPWWCKLLCYPTCDAWDGYRSQEILDCMDDCICTQCGI